MGKEIVLLKLPPHSKIVPTYEAIRRRFKRFQWVQKYKLCWRYYNWDFSLDEWMVVTEDKMEEYLKNKPDDIKIIPKTEEDYKTI